MRRWLPALAVRRPVTILMAFLALLVMGVIAWADIPVQMMPSGFTSPYFWVSVPYPGSTPLETDAKIVTPVQEQLRTVPGVKQLDTRASTTRAGFGLEFHQSQDLDEAYNSVADRMERAMPDLPDDVRNYYVYRFNPDSQPIVWAGIAIDPEIENPAPLVLNDLVPRVERLPGVAKVDVYGVDEKQVYIDFDRDAVFSHGVNLAQLLGELGSDNFQLASGRVHDRGQIRYVRSLARYSDLDELRRTPVAEGVLLQDIATVHYRIEPSSSMWHIDGKESAALAITKESSANTVDVSASVVDLLEEMDVQGLEASVFFSQGELIEESIQNLVTTALQGGLMAVIILFIFLRDLRMTLLIAASIPLSLVLTVTVLYFTGGSLNLLSLMGLMISVGMVVDNAIVVVETIYRRRQAGLDPREAAIDGTAEVNLAITLSTLTTMVVFLPLILMSENAAFSFFMGALGFPVVFALAASLLVALVFTPLTTVYLRDAQVKADPMWIQWLSRSYGRALRWILTRRSDATMGTVALIVLTLMVPMRQVSCTDQAEGNINDFSIDFELPSTYTYAERKDVLEQIEGVIEDHRDDWSVRVYRSYLSGGGRHGDVVVYLEDDVSDDRRREIREESLSAMPDLPGVRIHAGGSSTGGAEQANSMTLYVEGEDPQVLVELADEMARRVRELPAVLNAESALEEGGRDEIQLQVDRDAAARSGVSATSVGRTLSFAMGGSRLPDYYDGDEEVAVIARFQYEDRQDLDTLLNFPLLGTNGPVPLRALTEPTVTKGFPSIRRVDGKTSLGITVELDGEVDVFAAFGQVDAALADFELPRGYEWSKGRRFDDQVENDRARNMALLLSVTFVFLIMGVLFESFVLPLAIVTTIPMALMGVYWTLFLTGTPLDLMGGVGLVILVGVVVNNGIVLVDLVTQLRRDGLSRRDALVTAGERRLRPILMTALTTICGLLPMALGSSTFIGIPYAPLARVVAGGMAAATVLTLFFVPFLYVALDDLRALAQRVVGYVWPRARSAES